MQQGNLIGFGIQLYTRCFLKSTDSLCHLQYSTVGFQCRSKRRNRLVLRSDWRDHWFGVNAEHIIYLGSVTSARLRNARTKAILVRQIGALPIAWCSFCIDDWTWNSLEIFLTGMCRCLGHGFKCSIVFTCRNATAGWCTRALTTRADQWSIACQAVHINGASKVPEITITVRVHARALPDCCGLGCVICGNTSLAWPSVEGPTAVF